MREPAHVPPPKHQRQTEAQERETIDAADSQTIRDVGEARTQVQTSFDEMQTFW